MFRNKFLVGLLFAFLSLMMVVNLVHQVSANEDEDDYEELKTFTDVLNLVRKNYVEPVQFKDLVEGAIKGMLLSLDPHSSYLNQETYKELQVETKGEFGGLGIEITIKDGLLTVVSPIEDSPAYRAGVRSGDQIIKIGEEFTKDLTLVDAVKKMRGLKGSPITISVHREGNQGLIPLTVVRDIIKVKSVRYRMLDDGFGYIRLAQFQEKSSTEFLAALRELEKLSKDKKLHGIVIDIRNNPGGLLTEAIRVSDLFLKDGIVVYTDGRLESQKQKYYAHDDGNEPTYPIVVLVNGGSASASEIVSGALQDHGRALILGTQSFGKGSVQTILPMDGGAALRLTTALYYTKSGRSIQAQGISPDIVVSARRFPSDFEEVLEEDEMETKEKDLPGAIRNPAVRGSGAGKGDKQKKNEEVEEKKPTGEAPGGAESKGGKSSRKDGAEDKALIGSQAVMTMDLPKLLKDDVQLDEALKLLKTWYVFKKNPVGDKLREDKALEDKESPKASKP